MGGFAKFIRWVRPPLVVEHVRYVKKPDRDDIRAKAREMCAAMGKPVPEVLRP